MSPARVAALLLVLAYWFANASLHLAFSRLITSAWDSPWGPIVPLQFTFHATVLGGLIVVLFIALRARSGQALVPTLLAWVCIWFGILLSNLLLLTTLVEAIHYLQYGLISVLLAWVLDPRRQHWPVLEILLLSLLLSLLDEANQYLYLTAGQGSYFDFNDLWLNQLGALAGLLGYYGFHKPPANWPAGLPRLRRSLWLLLLALSGAVAGFVLFGRLGIHPPQSVPAGGFVAAEQGWILYLQREPAIYGHWLPTFTEGHYFVLAPWQGLGLLVLSAWPCSRRALASWYR